MTPQSPAASWTARAVRLSHSSAAIAALTGAPLILIATPRALAHDLPLRAVIDGHHVQPREDQLLAIGHPDVTPEEAAEVDRLYSELMRSREPLRGPSRAVERGRPDGAGHERPPARLTRGLCNRQAGG